MQVKPADFDIREYKKELRAKFKQIRRDMPERTKAELDDKICKKLVSTDAYKRCKRLLTYVSTEIEVDTMQLIHTALADGKTVAVPRCIDGTRNMDFYIITSDEQLEARTFGVLEPDPEKCKMLTCFDDAVCIVPALAYDMEGYRLGYGGGYYDRFLSAHSGLYNIGIEYCCCTVLNLVRGKFDVAANLIVTEKYIKKIKA